MTQEQFELLRNPKIFQDFISIMQLSNLHDRTLIYGYTKDRDTFHVYLKNNTFNIVLYNGPNKNHIMSRASLSMIEVSSCIPDKRVYPERCDFEFCQLLESRGTSVPYTTFDSSRASTFTDMHGYTLEDLGL